jgi:hypothetical protein
MADGAAALGPVDDSDEADLAPAWTTTRERQALPAPRATAALPTARAAEAALAGLARDAEAGRGIAVDLRAALDEEGRDTLAALRNDPRNVRLRSAVAASIEREVVAACGGRVPSGEVPLTVFSEESADWMVAQQVVQNVANNLKRYVFLRRGSEKKPVKICNQTAG